MGLPEDLQHLSQRRDSGELNPEEYEAEKSRLLDAAVNRIDTWTPKPRTSRIVPRVLRGTVTSVSFSDLKEKATLWIGIQKVTITRSGKPISIANGDRVLVGGTESAKGFFAQVYINETNGDNSVDEMRKTVRGGLWIGAVGMLGVLAVLATAAIAALREPKFLSISGAARSVIYVTSLAAAVVLGAISLGILAFSAHFHYVLHMVDREQHKYTG